MEITFSEILNELMSTTGGRIVGIIGISVI